MFEEEVPENEEGKSSLAFNPWVLKCHRDHLSSIINNCSTQSILSCKALIIPTRLVPFQSFGYPFTPTLLVF